MSVELADMSSLQCLERVDFGRVRESGIRGVWFRCTLFSGGYDRSFAIGVKRAREAGLPVGAYHFCYCGRDPVKQMRHFFTGAEGLGQQPGDLPPMIDWEFAANDDQGKPIAKGASCDWLVDASMAAQELWYPDGTRQVCIYTYPFFCQERQPYLGKLTELAGFPLVMATYSADKPQLSAPWDKVAVHQYVGDGGKVPGVGGDCDRDRFLGTEEEFRSFLGFSPTTAAAIIRPTIDTSETDPR